MTADNMIPHSGGMLMLQIPAIDVNLDLANGDEGFETDFGRPSSRPSPRGSPRSSPEQRRRWMSARVTSLMDDQDDEEEEELETKTCPDIIIDHEHSSLSYPCNEEREQNNDLTSFTMKVIDEEVLNERESAGSPLERFSENVNDMASFFWSGDSFDKEDMMLRTTKTLTAREGTESRHGHERVGSETDMLQKMLSSGPCGSTSFYKDENGQASEEPVVDHVLKRSSFHPLIPPPCSSSSCSDVNIAELRQILVADISTLLGSTSGIGIEWGCTVENWIASTKVTADDSELHRKARNRCATRNAQARRVTELWSKWHCHSDRKANEGWDQDPHRHTSMARSFDDADCIYEASPPVEMVDVYYDSDPEEFATKRRRFVSREVPRPDTIVCDSSFGSTGYGPCPLTPKASQCNRFLSFDSIPEDFNKTPEKPSIQEDVRLWDDHQVKEFIKDLTIGKISLVYHPPSENADKGCTSPRNEVPVSVQGWFEMGSRLQTKLVHPKFMWRETYQPDIGHRKLSVSCRAPASLDLLTMVRILKPAALDRNLFPYAKLDHSFTIKNYDGKIFLFEAQSTRERDWFVHGLKLVVARLASMIIVGDDQMFAEFFSPWGPSPFNSQHSTRSSKNSSHQEEDQPFYVSTSKRGREELWGRSGE